MNAHLPRKAKEETMKKLSNNSECSTLRRTSSARSLKRAFMKKLEIK
jgi:hypothetical protein